MVRESAGTHPVPGLTTPAALEPLPGISMIAAATGRKAEEGVFAGAPPAPPRACAWRITNSPYPDDLKMRLRGRYKGGAGVL